MAYEVTKQIKGRDYRYRVVSLRDPQTGRARMRWIYLGKLDRGTLIAPVRAGARRVTRDELIAVTATLLESRDASRVTVSVIAHHAGISPGTFYRNFADRDAALAAALALLANRAIGALPALTGPLGSRADEAARLNRWFTGVHAAVLRGRAFRWFLTTPGHDKLAAEMRSAQSRIDPHDLLTEYFRALDAAQLARIGDAAGLARGILTLHASVARDIALRDGDDATQRWAEIFPVIERAVFC